MSGEFLSPAVCGTFGEPLSPAEPDVADTQTSPVAMRHAYGVDGISMNGVVGDRERADDCDRRCVPRADAGRRILRRSMRATVLARRILRCCVRTARWSPRAISRPWITSIPPAIPGPSRRRLDVQWARDCAPRRTLWVVLANDTGNGALLCGDDGLHYHGVSVVSMSWGGRRERRAERCGSFSVTGVTFVASTGDDGAYTSSAALSGVVAQCCRHRRDDHSDGRRGHVWIRERVVRRGGRVVGRGAAGVPEKCGSRFDHHDARACPMCRWTRVRRAAMPVIDSYDWGNYDVAYHRRDEPGGDVFGALMAIANQGACR